MAESANIVNKMSLYDLLTLIIPGSMVVVVFYAGMYPWIKNVNMPWIVNVMFFGVMYMLGLLIKNMSLYLNKKDFNCNEDDIRNAYIKFAKETHHNLNAKKITYNDYCEDYYYAIKANPSSKVAILEGQVAFLRTIRYTLLVVAIICAGCSIVYTQQSSWTIDKMWLTFFILAAVLSVPPFFICIAHGIQKKVYEGVIYDSYYHGGPIAKRINNEKQI